MSPKAKTRPPKVGQWRSQEGFESYRAAYDAAMADLPRPSDTHNIATEYGTVRVYEWQADPEASKSALPVVLLPGIRSGTPMWGENIPHWIGCRPIYAMDAIGDCGMSIQSTPLTEFRDHTVWIEQTLAGLGLKRVHTVGHSFGGAMAAHHALEYPDRLASVTLLEPVMVLRSLPAKMYLWSAILALPFPQSWKDRALAGIGGVTVEEVRERTSVSVMIDEGTKHYASVTLVPSTLTDDEWSSLKSPVRVDIASDKSLAGGQNAVDRATSLGMDTVAIWAETTHSLPMQAAEPLGTALRKYWTSHEH